MLMNCISALDPLHPVNMHYPMLNTEIKWGDNSYQHSDDTQLFVDGALLLHPVIQYLEKTNYKTRGRLVETEVGEMTVTPSAALLKKNK